MSANAETKKYQQRRKKEKRLRSLERRKDPTPKQLKRLHQLRTELGVQPREESRKNGWQRSLGRPLISLNGKAELVPDGLECTYLKCGACEYMCGRLYMDVDQIGVVIDARSNGGLNGEQLQTIADVGLAGSDNPRFNEWGRLSKEVELSYMRRTGEQIPLNARFFAPDFVEHLLSSDPDPDMPTEHQQHLRFVGHVGMYGGVIRPLVLDIREMVIHQPSVRRYQAWCEDPTQPLLPW